MIVTLCGSTRFEADFHAASLELGRRGIICFTLAAFPSVSGDVSPPGEALDNGNYDKMMLDLGYLNKIVMSDAVLVVGSGYIGRSTSREILWAKMMDKPIVHQLTSDWNSIAGRLRSNRTDEHLIQKAQLVLKGGAQ